MTGAPPTGDDYLAEIIGKQRASMETMSADPFSTMPKVGDAIRLIERAGWIQVRMRGSHRQYKHPERRGVVTIPGRRSDDLPAGTWDSIMKQAGLKGERS